MNVVTYNAQFCPKRKPSRKTHVDAFATLAAAYPVVGVCEAGGYRSELRNVPGTQVIQPRGSAGRCALLIRKGIRVHASGSYRLHGRRFVGRNVPGARVTGWTKPRDILWALITDPDSGELVVVAVWHPVPGQSHSKRARALLALEAEKAASWLAAQKHPADLMGDTNGDPDLHLFNPLRLLAQPAFAVSRGGSRIDGHWIAGGHGTATALDGYPSDHKPVVADITWASQPASAPAPKEPAVGKIEPPAPPYVGPAAHTSAGSNQPIKRIVIHSTVSACKAGGARATAAYFRNPASGGSAHYVVDPSEAVQVVWDDTIAWHAPPNQGSIGVELCDMPGTDSGRMAPVSRWRNKNHAAMLDRAADLVAQLCLAYDVPIRKIGPGQLKAGQHGICGHTDVSRAWHQSDHWDPGHFPWDRFIALVQEKADALTGKTSTPEPAPAPAPAPVVAKPVAPAKPKSKPLPYNERQAVAYAKKAKHNAAKHHNAKRANRLQRFIDALLGRTRA